MEPPEVSIVIPAYKAQKYILDALGSVRRQTFSSWELLVVLDGPDAPVREKVEAFSSRFALGARILENAERRGLSATRNKGIEASAGKFIAFLDHDDFWESDHLERSLRRLEQSGADLSYCPTRNFRGRVGREVGRWGPTSTDLETFPSSIYHRAFIPPSSVVIRKTAFDDVGLFDTSPEVRGGAEDLDLWIRLIKKKKQFEFLSSPSVWYRKHERSVTSRPAPVLRSTIFVLKKHWDWEAVPEAAKKMKIQQVEKALFWAGPIIWRLRKIGWMARSVLIRLSRFVRTFPEGMRSPGPQRTEE